MKTRNPEQEPDIAVLRADFIKKTQTEFGPDSKYTRKEIEQFICSILEVTPIEKCEITGKTKERTVKLPEFELLFYKKIAADFGEPQYKEEPNPTLLFEWALIKKYSFGLRLRVEITQDGILRYKL